MEYSQEDSFSEDSALLSFSCQMDASNMRLIGVAPSAAPVTARWAGLGGSVRREDDELLSCVASCDRRDGTFN